MTDLTDLATLKTYMRVSDTTDDDILTIALAWASQQVRNFLQFDVIVADYTESYDGNDSNRLILRQRPIVSVSGLLIGQSTIAASAALSPNVGYFFDETRLILRGYTFVRGHDNVSVSYRAGYAANAVPANIVMGTCIAARAAFSSGQIDPNVLTESVPGAYNATFVVGLGDLPNGAKQVLAPDRRVALT